MKKLVLLIMLTIFVFTPTFMKESYAETISYPFDSITIIEAYKFEVSVPLTLNPDSLLYGEVELEEILTIYVGTLEFILDGVVASGSANVLIVTNSESEDLFQFLINNYSYTEGVATSYGFASHILIDPEVGVYKDLTLLGDGLKELTVVHNLVADTWMFIDNEGLQMEAIAGSFESETGLNIVISAYTGGGE